MLYLGMSLLILFACAYTLQREGINQLQFYGSIGAMIVTVVWGGYYALLRYEVDDSGLTRHLLGKKHYAWESISGIELIRREQNSQISLTLLFKLSDTTLEPLRLSSELLALSAMEELIEELRDQGKITTEREIS